MTDPSILSSLMPDHFVNRTDALRRLVAWLESPSTTCQVIGEPGIGKTAVVAELVRRYEITPVLWVTVASTIDALGTIRRWTAEHRERGGLIVLDDVPNVGWHRTRSEILELLSGESQHKIVFVVRAQDASFDSSIIEVGRLSHDDIASLVRSLGLQESSTIKKIAELCDGHPLVAQLMASAVIEQRREDYIWSRRASTPLGLLPATWASLLIALASGGLATESLRILGRLLLAGRNADWASEGFLATIASRIFYERSDYRAALGTSFFSPQGLGRNNAGAALYRAGDYESSSHEFDRAIDEMNATGTLTLTTLSNLATALQARGELDQAGAIHRQVLDMREQVLGNEHPDTLTSRANLAAVLNALGESDEAVSLYRETVEQSRKTLGQDHPTTLFIMSNLGTTLYGQGAYIESRALHANVLNLREQTLGNEHPDTLTSRANLAAVLNALGESDQAVSLYRETVEQSRKTLGQDHPTTLLIMSNLASALRTIGDARQARELWTGVLAERERILGPEHDDTIAVRQALASSGV